MKKRLLNYSFDASAKSIAFTTPVIKEGFLLITNATDNIVIFNFADPNKNGEVVDGDTLILTYDTTSMDDSDKLQIWYDDGSILSVDNLNKFPNLLQNSAFNFYSEIGGFDGWEYLGEDTEGRERQCVDSDFTNNYYFVNNKMLNIFGGNVPTDYGLQRVLKGLLPNKKYYVQFASYRNSENFQIYLRTVGAETELNKLFSGDANPAVLSGFFVTDAQGSDVTLQIVIPEGESAIAKITQIIVSESDAVWSPHILDILAVDSKTFSTYINKSLSDIYDKLSTVGISGSVSILAISAGDNNIGNVDVVTLPSIPAGTNAIGKLVANDGVDIGDVTINNTADIKITLDNETVVLGTGTSAIGKLIANSGIDIGDVTINNANGANAVNIQDGGNSITVDTALDATVYITGDAVVKSVGVGGNASGKFYSFTVDTDGHQQVDVLTVPTITVNTHAVTVASGGIASGSIASGAVASGAVVDGAIVTLGAKTDAKNTATDATSVSIMQVLKEISYMAQNPASVAVTNAGTFAVQASSAGDVAHDAQDAGNPVKMGAKAYEMDGTAPMTAPAELDRVNIISDRIGRVFVETGHPYSWSFATATNTWHHDETSAQTDHEIVPAVANYAIFITDVIISNGATAGSIILEDDTASGKAQRIGKIYLGINGGAVINLKTPIKCTVGKNLGFTSTSMTTHSVTVLGYYGV
jgi:hypothetical protein